MTHVVTDNCRDCKFTDCVSVCPVDCFYEIKNQLVIDPNECIDCGACVPECPVEAIFEEDELPDDQQEAIEFNLVQAQKAMEAGAPHQWLSDLWPIGEFTQAARHVAYGFERRAPANPFAVPTIVVSPRIRRRSNHAVCVVVWIIR